MPTQELPFDRPRLGCHCRWVPGTYLTLKQGGSGLSEGNVPDTVHGAGSTAPEASIDPHSGAVFVSYASQDAAAAERISGALRAAGIDVWFDRSELRGGEAWDRQIRKQIHDCTLFIPVISSHTDARKEGYFRREWRLAVERMQDMADDASFLIPVVIDDTPDAIARVPDRFREVQWTRLPEGATPAAFTKRILHLLSPDGPVALTAARTVATGIPTSEVPSAASGNNPAALRRLRPTLVLVVACLVLAAAFGLVYKFALSKHPAETGRVAAPAVQPVLPALSSVPDKSIAVLPFADMSEKHDEEYFSDGMSEELIDMLSKIPELRVPARTSSFYFKDKPTTIADIAKALSVLYVLEGSVRKSGGVIRVTAQLIRADNGYHIWSETYDRKLDDVFKVQDEIAGSVVRALKVSLLASATQRSPPTSNLAAYSLYLESMPLMRRGSKEDLESALTNLRKAVQLDPAFAVAWAALSRVLTTQGLLGYVPFTDLHDDAWHAAMQAINLDPDLVSAHIAIGKLRRFLGADYVGADAAFKRAIQLDPRDPDALRWAASSAASLGRFEEALDLAQQAITHDPLYEQNYLVIAVIYAALGQLDKAEAAARIGTKLNPHHSNTHLTLANVLLARGELDEALAESRLAEEAEGRLGMEAIVYQALGRTAEADAALAEFKAKFGHDDPFSLAEIYARRGDRSQALSELENAAASNHASFDFVDIKIDPSFKAFADDPRYKAILRRMKLPE
jgi:TolB-like protein/Tfp pilus assembly protein PilF